jgi:hypothetical protein
LSETSQTSPALLVRCDDKGVSFCTGFGIEIGNLPERESLDHNIAENLETVIDRGTLGSRNESWFSL